jgi:hypothetical protein
MSSIMINPLNHFTDITVESEESDEDIKINEYNIAKYFRNIYILCPMTNNLNSNIFNVNIESDELNNILNSMTLYETKINIVKNQIHYNNIIYIESEIIKNANKFNYDLNEKALILPIFNISFLNLKNYLDKISSVNNFKDFYDYLVINEYFKENIKNNYKNNFNIESQICNLEESKYWEYYYNCNLNFSKLFLKRNFNIQHFVNLDENVKELFKKLNKIDIDDNYLEEIFKFKKYIDPSDILSKTRFKLFRIEYNCDFTKEDMTNLFLKLSDKNRFYLFCKLLVSKKYCHLVFSNEILEMMMSNIKYHAELIQYLMGYTWLTFYMEECIKKSYLKTTDRVIFSIDVASKLPVFPVSNNVYKNPYLPMMVSDNYLNSEKNINGVEVNNNNYHRIATLEEFKERLNIFMTNNENFDIFNGIDFEKNKMALTGSVMTACLQYSHPLMKLFWTKTNTSFPLVLGRYFQEYYSEADVDIMIKTNDNFEFFDIVDNIVEKVKYNLSIYFQNSTPPVSKEFIKKTYVYISKNFIENNFDNIIPSQFIISNLNNRKIKQLLFPLILKENHKKIEKILEDFTMDEVKLIKKKYSQFFSLNLDDIIIRLRKADEQKVLIDTKIKNLDDPNIDILLESLALNDAVDKINFEEDFIVLNSYKVKVFSPLLDHNLEIFPIKGDDFLSSVNLFHLPCVRSYYNGFDVFLTPSCISSHLTFMNINYKYVAGTKDPLEIINKYRMRGFGTFLNENEIKLYIKYISSKHFWNNLFDVSKHTIKKCLGFISLNHKLFHPRLYNAEYFEKQNVRYIPIDEGINDLYSDPKQSINSSYPKDYLTKRYNSKITNVLDNVNYQNPMTGFIVPLKEYIIKYVIEKYNFSVKEDETFPIPPNNDKKNDSEDICPKSPDISNVPNFAESWEVNEEVNEEMNDIDI